METTFHWNVGLSELHGITNQEYILFSDMTVRTPNAVMYLSSWHSKLDSICACVNRAGGVLDVDFGSFRFESRPEYRLSDWGGGGYGFPHSLQENARIIPRLSHDSHFPSNIQFIIDKSFDTMQVWLRAALFYNPWGKKERCKAFSNFS
jgi:hypothetical protein